MQLPLKALTEVFIVTKAKVHMVLIDSKDKVIRDTLPAVKTQLDRCGIGHSKMQLWSRSSAKERKRVVVEIRQEEEKTRMTVPVGEAQQGAWTRWELVQERKIS